MLQSYDNTAHVASTIISPLRAKRRVDHQGSEILHRPRPMGTITDPVLQHSKRASIYVSDASIILAQRTPMASASSPLLSPDNATTQVDHYAILELDPQASTDEIKAAYRRLRVVYFQSDAKKYRALQAAFDTLLDPEARKAYVASGGPHPSLSLSPGIGDALETKYERKDSVAGTDGGVATVSVEDEAVEDGHRRDLNWALKRHQRRRSHVIGKQRYWSHIPVSTHYDWTDTNRLACHRPTYLGQFAVMGFPN